MCNFWCIVWNGILFWWRTWIYLTKWASASVSAVFVKFALSRWLAVGNLIDVVARCRHTLLMGWLQLRAFNSSYYCFFFFFQWSLWWWWLKWRPSYTLCSRFAAGVNAAVVSGLHRRKFDWQTSVNQDVTVQNCGGFFLSLSAFSLQVRISFWT